MISRFVLTVLVGIGATIWALILIGRGWVITPSFFLPLSMVVGTLSGIIWLFEEKAWAWPGIRKFIKRPDLRGTWKGTVRSQWTKPGGERIDSIETYLVIRQTFSRLHIRLITPESQSSTLLASLVCEADGVYVLNAVYQNVPKIIARSRSPIHHGGIILHLDGSPVDQLSGSYWTDRQTHGEIVVYRISPKQVGSFEAAQQLSP